MIFPPLFLILSHISLYEGYVRIPWNDKIVPQVSVSAECVTCGRETNDGILVKHDGLKLGFCTNRHYVEWWKTIHNDSSLNPQDFESPEERFKKQQIN